MELPEKMQSIIDLLPEGVDIVIIDRFILLSFQEDYEDELTISQIIQLAAANPTEVYGYA